MSTDSHQEADPELAGVSAPAAPPAAHDPFAILRERSCLIYLVGNMIAFIGVQMQTIALLWEVQKRFEDARTASYYVAWVGLIQVLPVFVFTLPAGHLADRIDRRKIVIGGYLVVAACAIGIALVVHAHGSLTWIYALLLVVGIARAFNMPARSALLPQVVAPEHFSQAVAWSGATFHVAAIVGPALGGIIIALFGNGVGASAPVYLIAAGTITLFCILLATVRLRPAERSTEALTFKSLAAGVGFVRRTKVILACLTLDMFGVLFGGAVALYPIYAEKILHVGARGMGWMRAAQAIGAIVITLVLTWLPPMRKAGRTMLWSVAGFGVATIVFGFSNIFWLSLLALAVAGACDMVSVVIRHTLVQVLTPDSMRGRVSAVNSVFISASNELGDFESGMVSYATSPQFSVVSGGMGTLAVVGAVMLVWPQLRRYGKLGSRETR